MDAPMKNLPWGFRFAGVHCGIKQDAAKEDLTLIVSDEPCVAAGVYTTNLIVAAPVQLDRQRTPMADARVLVANSGNANACTGERGARDSREMAQRAALACGAEERQSLVMSTGVIGHFLPMAKIAQGIESAVSRLGRDEAAWLSAARGITTTDRSPKIACRSLTLRGREVRVAGMAKGAGMIGPRMATMLGIIMTDVRLSVDNAQRSLQAAVDRSFNCISVEGHMSTNDTVLLLASGTAQAEAIDGDDLRQFQAALDDVCIELAKMIPDDGEGATHLITIDVRGCASREAAYRIAVSVANSALVKSGVAGNDPNWGRVVSAAGYAGVPFDPQKLQLKLNGTVVFREGGPASFDAKALSQCMRDNRETHLELEFGEGNDEVRYWTSDLTVDYVKFNSAYTT
jgi:glutamate N-acetyltransferase/amino-acid N-acetyltransferase